MRELGERKKRRLYAQEVFFQLETGGGVQNWNHARNWPLSFWIPQMFQRGFRRPQIQGLQLRASNLGVCVCDWYALGLTWEHVFGAEREAIQPQVRGVASPRGKAGRGKKDTRLRTLVPALPVSHGPQGLQTCPTAQHLRGHGIYSVVKVVRIVFLVGCGGGGGGGQKLRFSLGVINLFRYFFISLFICLFVCLFVYLFVCLFVCLLIY